MRAFALVEALPLVVLLEDFVGFVLMVLIGRCVGLVLKVLMMNAVAFLLTAPTVNPVISAHGPHCVARAYLALVLPAGGQRALVQVLVLARA